MASNLVREYPPKPSMNKFPSCNLQHMAYMARMFLAEMLGLGLILFVIVIYQPGDKPAVPVSLVVGAVFAWVICVFGPISGAQVNPAVSLALILTRRLSVVHGLICVVAQIVGATGGVLLGRVAGPANVTDVPNVGMTIRNPSISVSQAVGLEVFATMVLVGIVLAVSDEFRDKSWTVGNLSAFPLMFGITLFLLATVVGPYTGGSMNPALSLGGAIANANFREIWIYIVGPLIGSLIVTLGYELLLSDGASLARLKALATESNFDRSKNYCLNRHDDEEEDM
ncbi:hypothetical protein FGIG_11227 [Fasciola gigantica]|uniref:Aquaporin n=2 Tax=Fasciola gigantica TaxID=46835 RepID=A0A504YJ89_FASGI|nr:hypothetical protein FGIG_11227 [Fasciola gigantica]